MSPECPHQEAGRVPEAGLTACHKDPEKAELPPPLEIYKGYWVCCSFV